MTDITPEPIGPVHYSQPRGVLVRDAGPTGKHSAVQSPLIIYTDTVSQANELIKRWSEIMQVAATKAQEILDGVKEPEIPEHVVFDKEESKVDG